jgi:hypothetical protein
MCQTKQASCKPLKSSLVQASHKPASYKPLTSLLHASYTPPTAAVGGAGPGFPTTRSIFCHGDRALRHRLDGHLDRAGARAGAGAGPGAAGFCALPQRPGCCIFTLAVVFATAVALLWDARRKRKERLSPLLDCCAEPRLVAGFPHQAARGRSAEARHAKRGEEWRPVVRPLLRPLLYFGGKFNRACCAGPARGLHPRPGRRGATDARASRGVRGSVATRQRPRAGHHERTSEGDEAASPRSPQ